ncbi:MAG: hypothetical protein Ct9H300mP1_05620 [Planctomycetaceae bacterium]|nr:MAG: hypothetical protein Ct9H300mP1_05620 [Planctomycetaceae bacterium]
MPTANLIEEIPLSSRGVFAEAERMIRAVRRGHRLGKGGCRTRTANGRRPSRSRFGYVVLAAVDLLRLWFQLVILRRRP